MKLERSKNAIRNMSFGLLDRIVRVLGAFLIRTVFIQTLGAKYLGLNSLFASILTILSISDLGISTALIYSMYQAIASDDSISLDALLAYYKKLYRIVGSFILIIGTCLIPALPIIIKDEIPSDINLPLVYVVYLFNTSLTYFLFDHYFSLFTAFQRDDINQKISTVVNLVKFIFQCLILLLVHNYYTYVFSLPFFTVLNSIGNYVAAKKIFPQYRPTGKITEKQRKDIKNKISGIFIDRILYVSRNSFDSIFISMFLGLVLIAIYNNHLLIVTSVTDIVLVSLRAILGGVGNSIATETVEKNYFDMRRINFLFMYLCGWCTVTMLCLYTPFMEMWVGKDMLLPLDSVCLFCIYFYMLKIEDVRNTYIQATGLWRELRIYAIAEAVLNISINYVLGRKYGLNGIIFATIISLLIINILLKSSVLFTRYFKMRHFRKFLLDHFFYALVTTISCIVTYYICINLPVSWLGIIERGIICVLVPNALFLGIYRKTRIYKISMRFFLNCINTPEDSLLGRLLLSQKDRLQNP